MKNTDTTSRKNKKRKQNNADTGSRKKMKQAMRKASDAQAVSNANAMQLKSGEMLIMMITLAHVLTQIQKHYSMDDKDDIKKRLLSANFCKSGLE